MYTRFDSSVRKHLGLWLALILVVLLRLPSLCEPYWYGDEGIYLTIGNGLRQGRVLYAEIVDHKTPLIYYLAMVPNQMWFRILLIGWMLATTWFFYRVAKALQWSTWKVHFSTLLFVLLTSWPSFEGNIPNGELFVMGFILAGWFFLTKTQLWQAFLDEPSKLKTEGATTFAERRNLVLAGILGSLGLLTKVPALFDLASMGWIGWLILTRFEGFSFKNWRKHLWHVAGTWIWLGLGVLIPIVASVGYFWLRGALADYIQFGLLYNFHYAGNWALNLPSVWLEMAFTLPGKAMIMALLLVLITLLQRWQNRALSWSLGWLILALFASLLSNRPYPHYFLQLAPPLSFVLVALLDEFGRFNRAILLKSWHRKVVPIFSSLVLTLTTVALIPAVLLLLHAGLYQTIGYYSRWFKMVSGQVDRHTYYQQFNGILDDNTKASDIIRASGTKEIFIWGTNPMLYAQSDTAPTGRFTVAFHIKDLKNYDETMAALVAKPPRFIVVMNEDAATWPEINQFLNTYGYVPNPNFSYFTLWKLP